MFLSSDASGSRHQCSGEVSSFSERSMNDNSLCGNDAVRHRSATPGKRTPGKRTESSKPNYFVAIPILNPQLKERLTGVQQSLLESNDGLAMMLVKPETFHFTLMVFNMDDQREDHVFRARTALDECLDAVRAELYLTVPELMVPIDCLHHFNKCILFAKPRDSNIFDGLVKAADHVKEVFKGHDLPTTDKRTCNPHITLFKPKGSRREDSVWQTFKEAIGGRKDEEFGVELLTSLQLCSMSAEKRDDGYYKVLCERKLTDNDAKWIESIPLINSDLGVSPRGTECKEDDENLVYGKPSCPDVLDGVDGCGGD